MHHTARDHHFLCDGDDECITDNDNDGDDDNDADADDRDSGSLWADQAPASHWRTYWGGWRWRGEGGALPLPCATPYSATCWEGISVLPCCLYWGCLACVLCYNILC